MALHERIGGVMRVPGGWLYFIKEHPPVFVPLNNEFKPKKVSDKPKANKPTKPGSFTQFFDVYPPNKKGGRDISAWDKAKRLNLGGADFALMYIDVTERRKLTPSWYETYAPGITKYLDDSIWLTPIIKEKEAIPDHAKIPKDDAKLESWAEQHGYPAPGKGQSYNDYRHTLTTKVRDR